MDNIFLSTVGKIWNKKDLPENLVKLDGHLDFVNEVFMLLANSPGKSVIITGELGVGKSTCVNLVAEKLHLAQWLIFRASANDVVAGQKYIGEQEQNIKNVIQELSQKEESLWILPRLEEAVYVGSYSGNPRGVLDQIMPYIEKREIKVLAEVELKYLSKLLQLKPQLRDIFEIIRIEPSEQDFTLDLARQWFKKDLNQKLWNKVNDSILLEIYDLIHHFFPNSQNPGILINFLKYVKSFVGTKKASSKSADLSLFLEALSNMTGMPEVILDENTKLDIDELENHFSERVIGQQEAVQTIIERIAMIKAGLNDPEKPAGVFLFVGPTGTGKTEIAKTLANFLFGSDDRMIRLDMSEFQTADSIFRLTGDQNQYSESNALVHTIRKNPFSVILLDEFEKAHHRIWDLFLQVFDDGRLTDEKGDAADFRQSIIIMTSNAGSSLPNSNIGFNPEPQAFSEEIVYKSLETMFRPEFLNRIDRIVTFRPLSESVVRQILKNELKSVLKRRGIRQKKWSIEWEYSAIDFLMEKGYSATLGARPMKRAIEKYLLAPLSLTIVKHQYPKGDQFLFIKKKGQKLVVDFVDPEEPEISWEQRQKLEKSAEEKSNKLSLNKIMLNTHGELSEYKVIDKEVESLFNKIDEINIDDRKETLYEEMNNQEFWEQKERFETLDELEYIDRVQECVRSINSLKERLNPTENSRINYNTELLHRLASRVYVLNEAINAYTENIPQDALMKIHLLDENKNPKSDLYHTLNRIKKMYEKWANLRGMKLLKHETKENSDNTFIWEFQGFGAFNILEKEAGLHIFEYAKKENEVEKVTIQIEVIPFDYKLKERYKNLFSEELWVINQNQFKISRKYKTTPKKVIIDNKSNWRSHKWDEILEGNFDIIS